MVGADGEEEVTESLSMERRKFSREITDVGIDGLAGGFQVLADRIKYSFSRSVKPSIHPSINQSINQSFNR